MHARELFVGVEKTVEKTLSTVAILGGLGLLLAIVMTCLSIGGKLCRRVLHALLGDDFNPPALSWLNPILGEEEIVQYAVGVALFTALPWLTLQKGHITINLLQKFFSPTINRTFDLIGHLIFATVAYMIMTQQWFLIFKKTRSGQDSPLLLFLSGDWAEFATRLRLWDESQILGIPLIPFYVVAEICVFLFFIACVFCVLRNLREWCQ